MAGRGRFRLPLIATDVTIVALPMMTRNLLQFRTLRMFAIVFYLLLAGAGPISAQLGPLEAHAGPTSASVSEIGPVPDSQMVTVTLRLKQDAAATAALSDLIAQQGTPGSANYRQWITPADFASRFGANEEKIAAVTAWLGSQGMTVGEISPSKLRMKVGGSSAQVSAAFGVQLHQYREIETSGATVNYVAISGPISLPIAMGDLISGISLPDDRATVRPMAVQALGAGGAVPLAGNGLAGIEDAVDGNAAVNLIVTTADCFADFAAGDLADFQIVLRQAEAQGITVLATAGCGAESFPAGLAEVTAVTLQAGAETSGQEGPRAFAERTAAFPDGEPVSIGGPVSSGSPGAVAADGAGAGGAVVRPGWQFADGLPDDGLRVSPDVTADTVALAGTLMAISAQAGTKLGNVAPVLYALAKTPALYVQPNGALPGTWEAASGLGVVDLKELAKDFPRGSIGTSSLLVPSTYAPKHGASLTLTTTVTSTGGSGIPTGTVTFTSTEKGTLGTGVLNASGVATFTTDQLPAGTYTTTSVYGGDATYTGSTSGVATITVVGEVSVMTAVVAPGAAVGGSASIAVSVTSASGVGTPSGTVTVSPQGTKNTATATATISGTNGTATGTVLLPVYEAGQFTLLISCTDPDPSYTCNSPISVEVVVGKGATVTAIAASPTSPTAGQPYTLTATVAGSSPTGKAAVGRVAERKSAIFTSRAAATATATGGPMGNVQFMDGTTYLATAALASGVATYSGSSTSSTHNFNAMYSGDQNYGTSSSTTPTATGLTPTSTSLTASSYAISIGQTITFYSTVFSIGVASTQTGTVTYSAAAQGVLGSGTVSGGLATLTLNSLAAGSYLMTATYSGDSVFAGSSSTSTVVVTVAAGVATLGGSFTPASVPYGSDAVLTATASFGSGSIGGPSGTLTATIAGVTGAIYTQTLTASTATPTSVAVFTFPAPPPGIYTVTISCPAADTFSCAGAAQVPLTVVRGGTTTALTLTPPGPLAGQPTTMTATITNAGNDPRAYTFTGTVQFFANDQLLGTGTVNGVTASISAALPAGSAESITAVYSGDVDWATSISTPIVITVAALPTTIVVTSNVTSAISGVQVELTATVTNIAGGPLATTAPKGSVSFYDTFDGVLSLLGSSPLVSQGANTSIAMFNATGLQPGTHSVYGVYLGDTIYLGSTSSAIVLGTTNFAVTFVPATMTVTQGQTGLATLVVNFQGGFGGSVSFGCTPPPNVEITCSFSPAVLTASGTTTLNVGTVVASAVTASGQSVDARQHGGRTGGMATGAAMAMLLFCLKAKGRLPRLSLSASLLQVGFLAIVCLGAIGCTGSNSGSAASTTTPPVTTPSVPGTSLGTQILTITTAGSDGTNTVRHDFQYQVTVQ